METGEKIKELRLKRKLTQKQLAELAFTNFETISRIENCHHEPSRSILQLIAQALKTTVKALKGE